MKELAIKLKKVLSDFKKITGGNLESVGVISRDGLVIEADMSLSQKADDLAAMLATMVGAAETSSTQLGKGIPEGVIVKTKLGKVVIIGAGDKALFMVVSGRSDLSLDLLLMRMQKTANAVKQILG